MTPQADPDLPPLLLKFLRYSVCVGKRPPTKVAHSGLATLLRSSRSSSSLEAATMTGGGAGDGLPPWRRLPLNIPTAGEAEEEDTAHLVHGHTSGKYRC